MIADKIRAEMQNRNTKWLEKYEDGFTCGWDEAIEQAAQIAEENSGWISVDTRLPEPGQNVICIVGDNDTGGMATACFDEFFYYADCEDCMFEHVTHWQPLPQPPEAGE